MTSSNEIRQQFIDFFVARCGHTYVPSSPVVPHDDPTLLFTNAGMNQFKDVFLGVGERPYTRAVNTQKCIRAGGKHNDLDDVGKDTYHHTFFEMLGNWSFGDYFKRDAIAWAWQLLTEVWGIDKTRLHATVFEGDAAQGLERDDEAMELWRTVTDINPSHIHLGNAKDNFWEMGDTGPCGPCSEIHIDLTPDKSGGGLVNAGDARVMEIWNLVFMQFNRGAGRKLTPLPAKHVDTGMGFERICAVLQGKSSNYDTDVFSPIFDSIREVTGASQYTGDLKKPEDIAYRVIADHIRTLTFALTDGAEIGEKGRSYVLRRILRRAVRYGRQTLGVKEPFFYRLTSAVVESMGSVFPELKLDPEGVAEKIRDEEEQFTRTLDRGIEHFTHAASRSAKSAQITGPDAFELYATYGFPLDLTELMADERGMSVDVKGFNAEMARHRDVSRGEGAHGNARASLVELVGRHSLNKTTFVGYETMKSDRAQATKLLVAKDDVFAPTESLAESALAAVVLDQTPFYAESGGQVGDTGVIYAPGGDRFLVEDTIKIGDVFFHLGHRESTNGGGISQDEALTVEVDQARRQKIMAHHTTTHLLNLKLRAILGDHVQQKGSLVDDEKTRFDFSHGQALSLEQIEQIEKLVNEDIGRNLVVYAAEAPQEKALAIHGLRAVFGEKYPPMVRVVSIGQSLESLLAEPGNSEWYNYSIEFCGGTHLAKTGEAGQFVVVSEEGTAKGIRRITALAGETAKATIAAGQELLARADALAKLEGNSLEKAVAELTEQMNAVALPLLIKAKIRSQIGDVQKRIKEQHKLQSKSAVGQITEAARELAEANEGEVIVSSFDDADTDGLRSAMDVVRSVRPESALLFGSVAGDKVSFVAYVPKPLIDKGLKAGDWVREVAKVAGGGGGGRPDMAQAGGKDPSKLAEALEKGRTFAASKLS